MNKIDNFGRLLVLIKLFQKVSQISWSSDQTRKRYPAPEAMTEAEIEQITRVYFALGIDIEDVYREWSKIYKEYKNHENKNIAH